MNADSVWVEIDIAGQERFAMVEARGKRLHTRRKKCCSSSSSSRATRVGVDGIMDGRMCGTDGILVGRVGLPLRMGDDGLPRMPDNAMVGDSGATRVGPEKVMERQITDPDNVMFDWVGSPLRVGDSGASQRVGEG